MAVTDGTKPRVRSGNLETVLRAVALEIACVVSFWLTAPNDGVQK